MPVTFYDRLAPWTGRASSSPFSPFGSWLQWWLAVLGAAGRRSGVAGSGQGRDKNCLNKNCGHVKPRKAFWTLTYAEKTAN